MPLARDGQAPRTVLIEVSKGADALLITGQDRIDAHVIARLPDSVRVIATLSVDTIILI